jgi:hypothetical protein
MCFDACGSRVCGESSGVRCGVCDAGTCSSTGFACLDRPWIPYGWFDGFVAHGDALFFLVRTDGASRTFFRWQQPIEDGPEPQALLTVEPFIAAFAVNDETIFWSHEDGRVLALDVGGGEPRTLTTFENKHCTWLAANAQFVVCSTGNEIYSVAIADGQARLIHESASAERLLAGDDLYVLVERGQGIQRLSLSTGARTVLGDSALSIGGVFEEHLYYRAEDLALYRVPLSGGAAVLTLSNAFWAGTHRDVLITFGAGQLYASRGDGSAPRPLTPFPPESFVAWSFRETFYLATRDVLSLTF